jgi:hypothetical protein
MKNARQACDGPGVRPLRATVGTCRYSVLGQSRPNRALTNHPTQQRVFADFVQTKGSARSTKHFML